MKEGDIIKVRAQVTDWQGQTQLRIGRIRMCNADDKLDISDFIKAAPEKSEDMYDFIYQVADEMKDQDLVKLVEIIGYKEGLPVVTDPGILSPKKFKMCIRDRRYSVIGKCVRIQKKETCTNRGFGVERL